MRNFKSLFIASLLMFLGMTSFAQSKIEASNLTESWTLLHSENGIDMYIQYGECTMGNVPEAFQYGLIKLVNSNPTEKTISYSIERYYTDGCVGCNMTEEDLSSIVVSGNSSIIGNCENGFSILLKNPLQSMYLDLTFIQLTSFKIN